MKPSTFARKAARRLRYKALDLVRHRRGRDLYHVRRPDFEMLVVANEDVGRGIVLGDFERAETEFFRREIRAGDCCFDIGGNVGYFSMLMAQRASRGTVHVFEPIAFNVAMIQLNAQLNGFENIVLNNLAVADTVGRTSFSVSSDTAYSSMRASGSKAEAKQIDVAVTTIDQYAADHRLSRIDVIKVDVEGAEELVVKGGAGLLADQARRPRLVQLELYDGHLQRFDTSTASIIARMQTFGYSPHVLMNDRLTRYETSMASEFYNIFFTLAG